MKVLTLLQGILKATPALRVLKLTMSLFALDRTQTPTQMLCMPAVLRTTKAAAEKISGWKLPKLAVVVFVVEGARDDLLKVKKFAFMRSKEVGPSGEERFAAIAIEPHMVKHQVPCADILEEEKFVFT